MNSAVLRTIEGSAFLVTLPHFLWRACAIREASIDLENRVLLEKGGKSTALHSLPSSAATYFASVKSALPPPDTVTGLD
jgi:hypothetical protein